jgi:hypothetical protein
MSDQNPETNDLLAKFNYLVGRKDSLQALHVDHWKSHDQAILTLSSAILGLSLVFSNQVTRPLAASCALYGAWISFVFAVIATLVSFRLADADALWHIAHLDKQIDRIHEDIPPPENISTHAKFLAWVNNASGGLFVTGLILLLVFAIANLNLGDHKMSDQQHNPTFVEVQRAAGAVAPSQFPSVTPLAAGTVTPSPFPSLAPVQATAVQAQTTQSVTATTSNQVQPSLTPPSSTANK